MCDVWHLERTRDPVILRSPYDEHQLIVAIALGIIEGNAGAKGEKSSPDPRRTQSITDEKQQRSHMLVHGSLSLSDIDLLPLCHGGQLVSAQMDKWIIVYYLKGSTHSVYNIDSHIVYSLHTYDVE